MADNTPIAQRSGASDGATEPGLTSAAPSFIIEPAPGVTADYVSTQTSPASSRSTIWYLEYYIPSIDWVRNYTWDALPGDICSGITLASFQIPVSLSYATSLANIDAVCGLYGLIAAPLMYALLGSVPTMVVAPEGPISLIIGKLAPLYFTDPSDHMHGRSDLDSERISAMVAGTAGAVLLFLGLMRAGFLTSVLAQSLLRGFVTGVGVVMIADQLPAMLGMSKKLHEHLGLDASSFAKAKYTLLHWRDAHPIDSQFSLYGLAAIVLFKIVKKYLIYRKGYKRAVLIPDILLVVIASSVVSKLGNFASCGLNVVGKVSTDNLELLWMLRPKYWSDFRVNFQSSFYIAILGLLESTVAARLIGSSSRKLVRRVPENGAIDVQEAGLRGSNRELVALGAANLVGSMFGALPAFGGYGRSKINILSGGTSQMSGVVAALLTLLCTYKLMGFVYHLPKCTLSAIIASIGISLIEEAPAEINFFWKVRSYSDLAIMSLSLAVTFFWSVEAGVTVGTGAAILRVVHHSTRPRIQILARNPVSQRFVLTDGSNYPNNDSVLVVKIPEPLTFANSTQLEDRLRRLELHGTTHVHPGQPRTRHEQLRTVVFHLKGMTECDACAASTLKNIIERYLSRGVRVMFTELLPNPEMQDMLKRSGIVEILDRQPWERSFFPSVQAAIDTLETTA